MRRQSTSPKTGFPQPLRSRHTMGLRLPRQLTFVEPTARSDPFPAMSVFPAIDGARTHLGHLPTSPTDGLRAHDPLRSPPAMAALSANRRGLDTFRAYGPQWSTIDRPRSTLPATAIAAAPGRFNAPFPTRHTSPVMTNDRVSPLSPFSPGAEYRRNGSAIRQPISCGVPRPARVFVRIFAAAS